MITAASEASTCTASNQLKARFVNPEIKVHCKSWQSLITTFNALKLAHPLASYLECFSSSETSIPHLYTDIQGYFNRTLVTLVAFLLCAWHVKFKECLQFEPECSWEASLLKLVSHFWKPINQHSVWWGLLFLWFYTSALGECLGCIVVVEIPGIFRAIELVPLYKISKTRQCIMPLQ